MERSCNLIRREEILVWVGVLACLLVTEIVLRVLEPKLSLDVAHIRKTPQTARKIAEGREQGRLQVLFIGNSLTRAGVDPGLLDSLTRAAGEPRVDFHFFYPDGGNVGAWNMAWARYFEGRGPGPDLVLLCGGRSHFRDIQTDPVLAGSYYLSWRHLPAVLFREYLRFDDKVRLVASKISVGFANRQRVQRRVRDKILPHNRDVLWDMASRAGDGGKEGPELSQESSRFLGGLLGSLREEGIATAVVAMPSYQSFEIPVEMCRLVESYGARLVDLRSPVGISPGHFYDRAHLDKEGAKLFTRALFVEIGPMISELSRAR